MSLPASDIHIFAISHNIKLNPAKCKEMFINSLHISNSSLNPTVMGNNIIERVKNYRILGVIMNNELKWNNNVDFSVNDIWNKSYMNCGNEMEVKRWSSQWAQFMQLRKEAWKKKSGLTPLKSWFFFQASLRNCINCVHCDDHFFISNVDFIVKKASKKLYSLRILCRAGVAQDHILKVYQSTVRPVLEYAVHVL